MCVWKEIPPLWAAHYGITSVKCLIRSFIEAPVASKILAMLLVDGQRGCPYLDQRLLLLNVVGSNPLYLAKPEQDMLCSFANTSIAYQISLCVIFFLLVC